MQMQAMVINQIGMSSERRTTSTNRLRHFSIHNTALDARAATWRRLAAAYTVTF